MLFGNKKSGSIDRIVVFLGNPGARYDYTRHNAGFMTADAFCKKHGIKIDRLKFKALTAQCVIGNEKILLVKPQTFMNLSGDAVRQCMDFYKVPTEKLLVVSDDVSLDIGMLRIRKSGSAGGHNGLKDIIAKCGGEDFPRIKIGVGQKPHPDYDMADWVLGTFKNEDAVIMKNSCERAADAIDCIIENGFEKAMEFYNRRVQ